MLCNRLHAHSKPAGFCEQYRVPPIGDLSECGMVSPAAAQRSGRGDRMKAMVRQTYGPPDVVELKDVPKPVPQPDEVLVRVHAAGVNMADVDYLYGRPPVARLITGLRHPRTRSLGSMSQGSWRRSAAR